MTDDGNMKPLARQRYWRTLQMPIRLQLPVTRREASRASSNLGNTMAFDRNYKDNRILPNSGRAVSSFIA
jgi:hypothetical protein